MGHAILVMCYHLLDRHVAYQELGGDYFDEHERQAVEKRLVRRLEKLGNLSLSKANDAHRVTPPLFVSMEQISFKPDGKLLALASATKKRFLPIGF